MTERLKAIHEKVLRDAFLEGSALLVFQKHITELFNVFPSEKQGLCLLPWNLDKLQFTSRNRI